MLASPLQHSSYSCTLPIAFAVRIGWNSQSMQTAKTNVTVSPAPAALLIFDTQLTNSILSMIPMYQIHQ